MGFCFHGALKQVLKLVSWRRRIFYFFFHETTVKSLTFDFSTVSFRFCFSSVHIFAGFFAWWSIFRGENHNGDMELCELTSKFVYFCNRPVKPLRTFFFLNNWVFAIVIYSRCNTLPVAKIAISHHKQEGKWAEQKMQSMLESFINKVCVLNWNIMNTDALQSTPSLFAFESTRMLIFFNPF